MPLFKTEDLKGFVLDQHYTRCICCGVEQKTDRKGERFCAFCVRYCDTECQWKKGPRLYGAYLLAGGQGKPVAAYSRCEDPFLARAELLLNLPEVHKARPGVPVWGVYDVDTTFGVEKFLDTYNSGKLKKLLAAMARLRQEGWRFRRVKEEDFPVAAVVGGRPLASVFFRDLPIYPGDEVLGEYVADKWAGWDTVLSQPTANVVVACPEVLGDNYLEFMVNLSKLAEAGKTLAIAKPAKTIEIKQEKWA